MPRLYAAFLLSLVGAGCSSGAGKIAPSDEVRGRSTVTLSAPIGDPTTKCPDEGRTFDTAMMINNDGGWFSRGVTCELHPESILFNLAVTQQDLLVLGTFEGGDRAKGISTDVRLLFVGGGSYVQFAVPSRPCAIAVQDLGKGHIIVNLRCPYLRGYPGQACSVDPDGKGTARFEFENCLDYR